MATVFCRYFSVVTLVLVASVNLSLSALQSKKKCDYFTIKPLPPPPPPPPTVACEAGWTQLNDRCYKYFDKYVNHFEAKDHCRDLGAHLATMRTQAERDLLNSYFTKPLSCKSNYKLFWEKCFSLSTTAGDLKQNTERARNSGANMVSIHTRQEVNFIVNNVMPSGVIAYLGCTNPGGQGWRWRDGSRFNYTFWGRDQPDRRYSCTTSVGANIGKWRTEPCDKTHRAILQMVPYGTIWAGLYRKPDDKPGNFFWTDQQGGLMTDSTYWDVREPLHHQARNCVLVWPRSKKMRSEFCSVAHASFVCEKGMN